MKKPLTSVLALICNLLLWPCLAPAAHAGQYYLDHYHIDLHSESKSISYIDSIHKSERYYPNSDGVTSFPDSFDMLTAQSGTDAHPLMFEDLAIGGTDGVETEATDLDFSMTVTPIYKWSGDDTPSPRLRVLETSSIELILGDDVHVDAENDYYGGQSVTTSDASNGITQNFSGWNSHRNPFYSVNFCASGWRGKDPLNTGSALEFSGPSRTLTTRISIAPFQLMDGGYFHLILIADYQAKVVSDQIDAEVDNLIANHSTSPNNQEFDAYYALNHQNTGPTWEPGDIHMMPFWDGHAAYTSRFSPDLGTVMGNIQYHWSVKGIDGHGNSVSDHPMSLRSLQEEWSQQELDESDVDASTQHKNFHHYLDFFTGYSKPDPGHKTTTRVLVTGDNPESPILKEKVKVRWSARPQTQLRTEIYAIVHDYSTTPPTSREYPSLEAAFESLTDDINADMLNGQVQSAYKGTVIAGQAGVEWGFNVEKSVLDWFIADAQEPVEPEPWPEAPDVPVPDPDPNALPPLPPGVKAVVEIAESTAKFAAIVDAVKAKLDDVDEQLVAAIQAAQNPDIEVEIRERTTAIKRVGTLPPGAVWSTQVGWQKLGVVDDRFVKMVGSGCFGAGTMVATPQGPKAIETIKPGDEVYSRSRATGESQVKKVTQTFVHTAGSTRTITFSNGDAIVTTEEHPFYAENLGFLPAKSLGIGTSIVTRAGPCLTVRSNETASVPTEVYNLEVEGFHTYFVGSGEVWVHNACSAKLDRNLGGFPGDKKQAHHLVPGALENHPFVRRAMAAGWDIDGASNGVLLYDNSQDALAALQPYHSGSHSNYSAYVKSELDNLENQAITNNWTPQQAKAQIDLLTPRLLAYIFANYGPGVRVSKNTEVRLGRDRG